MTDESRKPLPVEPTVVTAATPGIDATLGTEPTDFVVEEIPAYEPSGEGPHLYLWVEKVGWTTEKAARALARAADVNGRDVGYAGQKDKWAVTRQWFSLPAERMDAPDGFGAGEIDEGLTVLAVSRHRNKLRPGHLHGNRFSVRLVGAIDEERARTIVEELNVVGVPNFFGAQRFGFGGSNLPEAIDALRAGELSRGGRKGRYKRRLYASVLQSEVFNRYLLDRVALGWDAPLHGEVVRLAETGSHFVVDDPTRELPRWQQRDILPTGPMPGQRMLLPSHDAFALEEKAMSSIGLSRDDFDGLGRLAPGTRRDALVVDPAIELSADDERVWLRFSLPPGAYATQVIRELIRHEWLTDPRRPGAATDGTGE